MSILTALSRLSIQSVVYRSISTDSFLYFKASPCLLAEPLKKKKRVDPAVVKAREERKKKKLEKQIRRLERNARQLKPIEECEIPMCLTEKIQQRARKDPILTATALEQRVLLQKQWAKYKHDQHLSDLQMLDRFSYSQQRALDELRKESEDLYQEAIQIDSTLLPYKSQGPVETPAIENYDTPDGDYLDVSKKWE